MQKNQGAFYKFLSKTVEEKQWISLDSIRKKTHNNKNIVNNNDKLSSNFNVSEFKVVSPFYDKNKVCLIKNCTCPYHKKPKMPLIKIPYKRLEKIEHVSLDQSRSNIKLQNRKKRSSHKINLPPQKSLERRETMIKKQKPQIDTFQKQFDAFLEQNKLLFCSKDNKPFHLIKSSVKQIFTFLYNNLDKDYQWIKTFINSLQMDRDLKQLYIQRFMQLKTKVNQTPAEQVNHPGRSSKISISDMGQLKKGALKFSSLRKLKTKTSDLKISFDSYLDAQDQQLNNSFFYKEDNDLYIKKIIEKIQQGKTLEDQDLNDLIDLDIEEFAQNCLYIQRQIPGLKAYKEQIQTLLKDLKSKISSRQSIAQVYVQKKILIQKLINNQKIQQSSIFNEIYTKIISRQKKNSQFIKSNKSSFLKPNHRKDSMTKSSFNNTKRNSAQKKNEQNKQNQQTFTRSQFEKKSTVKFAKLQSQQSDRKEQGQKVLADQLSTQRYGLNENLRRKNTLKQQQNDLIAKNGRVKLAKFRRLSHEQAFKKWLNGKSTGKESKLKFKKPQDIQMLLDILQAQSEERSSRRRLLEKRLSKYHLSHFMINDKDSLFTIKRKIHALKQFLKALNRQELQQSINQYLELIEQQIYIKNRSWAKNKLMHLFYDPHHDKKAQQNREQDQIEQNEQDSLEQAILNIFKDHFNLIFYKIKERTFVQRELNMQQTMFCQFNTQANAQKKKIDDYQKTKQQASEPKKEEIIVKKKSDELVQVDLKNKVIAPCLYQDTVDYCFSGGSKTSYYDSSDLDDYKDILRKLTQLSF